MSYKSYLESFLPKDWFIYYDCMNCKYILRDGVENKYKLLGKFL